MHHTFYLHAVACHLHSHVYNQETSQRDAFARSAYNRYYYACFLLLREALSEMHPRWKSITHSDFPALLNGTISKRLRHERDRAVKSGDHALQALIQRSLSAASEIADIIKEARALRITADYYPDVSVSFTSNDGISLNNIDIERAKEWYTSLSILLPDLQSTWKQISA